jgi:hypothetical protein
MMNLVIPVIDALFALREIYLGATSTYMYVCIHGCTPAYIHSSVFIVTESPV